MKVLGKDKALELVMALWQMKGFPQKSPPAVNQLRDALMLNHKEPVDEALAVRVIDAIVQDATSETECPMPRDIRSAILAKMEPYRYDPDCPKCHGNGAYGKNPVIRPNGLEDWPEGSIRCDCLARRPAPVWEKASAALPKDHMPAEFADGIRAAVKKGVVQ
jgi:hypothetical protein